MKRNLKKLLLLSLAVPFLSLTSCGGSNEEEGIKIIKVWVHKSSEEPEGKVYNQIKNNFNNLQMQTNDGRTIRMAIEFYGSTLETKISGAILTHQLPDIVAIDSSDIAAKVNAEIVVPIDSYVSTMERESYIDSVIEQSTIGDHLYALSGMEAPAGLYYNKDILKSVGYAEEDFGTLENPWSWTDVFKAMKTLKNQNRPYQIKLNLGFGDDGYMYLYSPLVYSAGGTFGTDGTVEASLTRAESIAGIKQLERFFQDKNTDWVYSGTSETAFAEEVVPFQIYGPWDARTIEKGNSSVKGHYDIMPYPVYESESGEKSSIVATPCGSFGFAVTRDAKDVEAATQVIKYLTGKESSEMMHNAIGTFPTHKELLSTMDAFQSGPMKSLASYLLANTYTRPKMVKYPQLKVAYGEVLTYIKNMQQVGANYDLEKKIRDEMRNVDLAKG